MINLKDDTINQIIKKCLDVPLSIHCWQGDDLTGFISGVDSLNSGGIMATGNHIGKAKDIGELQSDLETALKFIPGKKKINLHSVYAKTSKPLDLNDITYDHFKDWIDWAKTMNCGIDFNPTCFSHPMAEKGFTLSSKDNSVRRFWIQHIKNTRSIAERIGEQTGQVCIHNIWIPDGAKDCTVDRIGHRALLCESLDEILSTPINNKYAKDAVESKLFGIGSESFVVGSSEFYLLYASKNNILPCMDMGHYHPTESVADKISSLLLFFKNIQLHISRGVRWDSDHVAIYNDELTELMLEIARANAFDRIHFALDYFDASINRLMAWIIGARATRKAMLRAMLEPKEMLILAEESGNYGRRLALLEEMKNMPLNIIWEKLCKEDMIEPSADWIMAIEEYEKRILLKR